MTGDLRFTAKVMDLLGATIEEWPDEEHGGHALALAAGGWEVFPLHRWDCRCRGTSRRPGCAAIDKDRGKRPHTLHGVLDATSDLATVAAWWSRWPDANIGARVPEGVVVVDIDPRHDGDRTWAELVAQHGTFATRTAITGRGDDGGHIYVGHRGGKPRGTIGQGIDVKGRGGYVVLPPSRHAAGGRYRWEDVTAPIAMAPSWLATLLTEDHTPSKRTAGPRVVAGGTPSSGDSVADWFSEQRTWAAILEPHGWRNVSGDGDCDGSVWLHPAATSSASATVKHGCLFVYSPNTPFDVTVAKDPRGYTRFRAFATLDHGGDLSAAARAVMDMRRAAS